MNSGQWCFKGINQKCLHGATAVYDHDLSGHKRGDVGQKYDGFRDIVGRGGAFHWGVGHGFLDHVLMVGQPAGLDWAWCHSVHPYFRGKCTGKAFG